MNHCLFEMPNKSDASLGELIVRTSQTDCKSRREKSVESAKFWVRSMMYMQNISKGSTMEFGIRLLIM